MQSPNIALLDSKIIADLCEGQFYFDITPSVWIGGGKDNVQGVKFKIENTYGVEIREYPLAFDAAPAFSGGMDIRNSFPLPTQNGAYQYGKYTITAQLTDQDGTLIEQSKSVSICAPNADDVKSKFGKVDVRITGVCKDSKVYILLGDIPLYKGITSDDADYNVNLYYPSGTEKASINTPLGSFSVELFEGVYSVKSTICASYNYGDNVFAKVSYQANRDKPIICSLDECCVFTGLQTLNNKLAIDCSDAEKKDTQTRIDVATLLLDTIDFGVRCGEDIADYVLQLEDVLGTSCGCSYNKSTPFSSGHAAQDILIEGCNVSKQTVGLTTLYTIENYSYETKVAENGGALTIAAPVTNGCVVSKTLTFNIATVYSQLKSYISADYEFNAAVIMKALQGLDASCIGLTTSQLKYASLSTLFQKLITKACEGGTSTDCSASISTITFAQQGADVLVSWAQTGSYSVEIYVDGLLISTVTSALTSYLLKGFADSNTHNCLLVPKCVNGIYGTSKSVNFSYVECPQILPPSVSSSTVTGVTCPFDLTTLPYGMPTGIYAAWFDGLLPDGNAIAVPQSVGDGTYYVYATDGSCYSKVGVKVTVACAVAGSCTAPQSLNAVAVVGGVKVSFSSALYPPTSYTIYRKLFTEADGSYVSLGAPMYNAGSAKWEKVDTATTVNTRYVYKAVSNCDGSSPSITKVFQNMLCPLMPLSANDNSISYTFSSTNHNEIDKYTVEIWSLDYSTLIHTDTITSIIPTITGSFLYLSNGVTYNLRVVQWIGTDSFPCSYRQMTVEYPDVYISGGLSFAGNKVYATLASPMPCDVTIFPSGQYTGAIGFTAGFTIAGGTTSGVSLSTADTITCLTATSGSNFIAEAYCGTQKYIITFAITGTICS